MQAHAQDLRAEVHDDALAAAVARDYRDAPLAPADRAMLDFAVKLTRDPHAMARADVEALRAHGLADRAIHDVVQVAAYFNYINRVANGLGIDPEPDMEPWERK